MFGITLWVLLYRRPTKTINRPMVVVAILLFVLSTTVRTLLQLQLCPAERTNDQHLGVDIHRIISGLIDNRNYPGGPALWFANPSQSTFVTKNAIYSFQTVLGDGVVVSTRSMML